MCTESCIGQEKNQKFTEINILKGRLRKKKKKKATAKPSVSVFKVRCLQSAASAVFVSERLLAQT